MIYAIIFFPFFLFFICSIIADMRRESNKAILQVRNWFIILALLGLVVLLSRSVFFSIEKVKTSRVNLQQLETEYQAMYDRQKSIEELLSAFDSDFGFEKYVRENFGVVRPGEQVILIDRRQNNLSPVAGQD